MTDEYGHIARDCNQKMPYNIRNEKYLEKRKMMEPNIGLKKTSEKFIYPNNVNNKAQYELNKGENFNHIKNSNYNYIGNNNFRGFEGNNQQAKKFGYNKEGLFNYKNNPSNLHGWSY